MSPIIKILLIPPNLCYRYNAIFKFLLAVKRVQVALHKSWKQQMCRWKVTSSEEEQALLHQIRNHMQFLVDNLQTYLQVILCNNIIYKYMVGDFDLVNLQNDEINLCFILFKPLYCAHE